MPLGLRPADAPEAAEGDPPARSPTSTSVSENHQPDPENPLVRPPPPSAPPLDDSVEVASKAPYAGSQPHRDVMSEAGSELGKSWREDEQAGGPPAAAPSDHPGGAVRSSSRGSDFSSSTSISGASSGELLTRRLRKARDASVSWAELWCRIVLTAVVIGLLVAQFLFVLSIRRATDDLVARGPRVTVRVRCAENVPAGSLVSGSVSGGDVVAGLGTALTSGGSVVGTAEKYGNSSLVGVFPGDSALLVTSRAGSGVVVAGTVGLSQPMAVLQEYTFALVHSSVVSSAVHPTPLRTARLLGLLVVSGSQLSVSAVAFYSDSVSVSAPVAVPNSLPGAGGMIAAASAESPHRFVVSALDGSTGSCTHHLYELDSDELVLRSSQASGHIACDRLRAQLPFPAAGGYGRAVLVADDSVTLLGTDGDSAVEWDAISLDCASPVLAGVPPQEGNSSGHAETAVLFCGGPAPGTAWLLRVSEKAFAVYPLPALSGVGPVVDAVQRPLVVSPWDERAQGFYLLSEQAHATGGRTYTMTRCVVGAGGVDVRLSQPVRLPPDVQQNAPLFASVSAAAQGSHAVTVIDHQRLLRRFRVQQVVWIGGLASVGVTEEPCNAGDGTSVVAGGVVRIPAAGWVLGGELFTRADGVLTQNPVFAGLLSAAGYALSADTAVLSLR
eukprot:TRINITY_DN14520_c0_g1_i2.p1 TRINITY_DN14520_c0_g1~~TRINITY_DN14520_c0_g1_i2.p1  ORF type:complete len:688 (+),score=194.57 TRINITY_DN14520_c0_g1_i2:60-2066(+)